MLHHPSRPSSSLKAAMLGVALSAACIGMPRAQAQIFTGLASHPSVTMPDITGKIAEPSPQSAQQESKRETLRFLPNTLDGLALTGETGGLSWPLYVTGAQARSTSRFRIGYLSAVSVLPDTSFIELKINNVKIGTDPIDAASGLRTVDFSLPAGTLQAGYNAVSLSIKQRHRVDCSVAATYELWTKIDPAATGLILDEASRGIMTVSELPALLPKSDGTLPIHILLSGKTNPLHVQRLIKATQEIALSGHFLQPAVDFGPSINDDYGLDVALGTRAALGQLPQLAGLLETTGPLAKIATVLPSSRPTLIVTGSSDEEVDQAIAALGRGIEMRGSPEGLEAIAHYPALPTQGATTLKLRDLGAESQEFDGRLFHTSVNLQLPPDFLASDYGRGTFDLAGGYAAGLAPGAQVRVDINGQNAGVIKLPDVNGETFKHSQLFLPLSLMTAGLNRIDIMAETPRDEDSVCGKSEGRRFLFLDNSQLTLPMLAHVQRLPDLSEMSAGGLPYLKGTPHLVVPQPDRETMAAALSLSARAAVTAGKVIPFQFSTAVGSNDDGSTLIVSPAQQLDPSLMQAVGLDPVAVEMAWREIAAQAPSPKEQLGTGQWWKKAASGPSACRQPARVHPVAASGEPSQSSSAPAISQVRQSQSDDLMENWTHQEPQTPSVWNKIALATSNKISQVLSKVGDIHFPTLSPPLADGVAAMDASLILAQGISPGSRDNVTTIVTAPDAAILRASMACLFDPQIWSKVRGRLSIVSGVNGDVIATPATSFHYVASGQPSLANSRLILAGWFSLNPLAFTVLALLSALCLSGTTLWFVRNIGRKHE